MELIRWLVGRYAEWIAWFTTVVLADARSCKTGWKQLY